MDAILIIIMLYLVYAKSMKEVKHIQRSVEPEDGITRKIKLNPDFYEDDRAFLKLHDKILSKGHPKP